VRLEGLGKEKKKDSIRLYILKKKMASDEIKHNLTGR
jgi:hypothetical protein